MAGGRPGGFRDVRPGWSVGRSVAAIVRYGMAGPAIKSRLGIALLMNHNCSLAFSLQWRSLAGRPSDCRCPQGNHSAALSLHVLFAPAVRPSVRHLLQLVASEQGLKNFLRVHIANYLELTNPAVARTSILLSVCPSVLECRDGGHGADGRTDGLPRSAHR